MPEIPELNVIKRTLDNHFKGHKVKAIEILWTKRIKASQDEFNDLVSDQKLVKVGREGKEIHLALENGSIIGIHLMLSGRMEPLPEYDDIKFPIFKLWFDDGKGIVVADGMGQAKAILNPEIPNVPDVMSKNFTLDYFQQKMGGTGKAVKFTLQNQKWMRGIGNAYSDEILWKVRISPFSTSSKIPVDKVKELYHAIHDVTNAASQILEGMKNSELDFDLENKDHRFVHNSKLTETPDGEEILKGKVENSKTYYTASQILYE